MVCIGDGRRYNTALILLDADFAPQWAAQNGLGNRTLEGVLADLADRIKDNGEQIKVNAEEC